MTAAPVARRSELGDALRTCRNAFIGLGVISCMINVLYLTGSLFMLEVYDRVLPSRSVPTLIGLAILAAGMYFFQGILDLIRGRILGRIGTALDEALVRLHAAKRPVVVAGVGARDDIAGVIGLAERLMAPVITTFRAKGLMSEDHPLAGGVLGQVLEMVLPMLAGAAGGGLDIGAIAGNAVGGGVAGAVVTAIIGMIKNKMAAR